MGRSQTSGQEVPVRKGHRGSPDTYFQGPHWVQVLQAQWWQEAFNK